MTESRNWVHNRWLDNCEERMLYSNDNRLSEQEYFRRFKWWLRREYRHQQQREKEQDELRQRFRQWS